MADFDLSNSLTSLFDAFQRRNRMTHSSVVLASVAILDNVLEHALKKAMKPLSKKLYKSLFESFGPLRAVSFPPISYPLN